MVTGSLPVVGERKRRISLPAISAYLLHSLCCHDETKQIYFWKEKRPNDINFDFDNFNTNWCRWNRTKILLFDIYMMILYKIFWGENEKQLKVILVNRFDVFFTDTRTTDWLLMSSPFPTLFICIGYVYVVKVLGPKIMENRKPFQLKDTLVVYNLFQVIFSAWLFYEVRIRYLLSYNTNCYETDRFRKLYSIQRKLFRRRKRLEIIPVSISAILRFSVFFAMQILS